MRFGIRSYKKIRHSSSPGYEVKLSIQIFQKVSYLKLKGDLS
nr:MAG TPA: hypothetical protein [Caudoviricetes sp.]